MDQVKEILVDLVKEIQHPALFNLAGIINKMFRDIGQRCILTGTTTVLARIFTGIMKSIIIDSFSILTSINGAPARPARYFIE